MMLRNIIRHKKLIKTLIQIGQIPKDTIFVVSKKLTFCPFKQEFIELEENNVK